jgi:hypothetical protein
MIGHPPCYVNLMFTYLWLCASTNCTIAFWHRCRGILSQFSSKDTFSVSLYPKPLLHKDYLATPLRVIPSFLFDDPYKDYLVTPLMTNPTVASQFDPGNFKPLDMSKIPGYPRRMPPRYGKWLPIFTGSDWVRVDNHMDDFWAFFQIHPISDDAKDLEMKLFSSTLHVNAREWYDDILDASITSMDQLEEIFLKRWGIKLKDIQMLLKRLKYIKQTENETVREFQDRFENLLGKIPRSHHPEDKYLDYLYTNALLLNLRFLLSKKGPKTIHEAHNMAIDIKENISLSKKGHLFTPDTLSLERLVSLKTFTDNFQEIMEKDIDQQGVEEKGLNEGFQSHEEEQAITHASTEDNEDIVEE